MSKGFMKFVMIASLFATTASLRKAVDIDATLERGATEQLLTTKGKTPNLDWEGCKSWTRSACEAKEGCHIHKLWLDTWRQQCRYTDEYKLRENQVERFFPAELARLEEKTAKFAKTGCITGGWWYKCHRRMQQILRLFNYVRKAKADVLEKGESHPAYQVVSSDATQERLAAISENLATGLSKNKMTKDLCIHKGVERMAAMPAEVSQIKKEASEKGFELTEAEVSSIEQAKQAAALLALNCAEVSDEQEKNLRAVIESSGHASVSSSASANDDLDGFVQDSEDMMEMLDDDDREAVKQASGEREEDDEGDNEEGDDEDGEFTEHRSAGGQHGNSSLVETSAGSTAGPLKALVVGGWKGLKWLVSHGVGWLFRRIVWSVAFLIGTAFSIVRAAALWPVLLMGCMTWRSLKWFTYDVLWAGENIGEGFRNIGRCAPEMWDVVGFDSNHPSNSAVSQIIVQPAKIASQISGVTHPLYDGADPCKKVTCGEKTDCQKGQCYCKPGFYPTNQGSSDCALRETKNGCRCQQEWQAVWYGSYYGCNSNGECKVDKQDRSYAGCKRAQQAHPTVIGRMKQWALGVERQYDYCRFEPSPKKVPAKCIDENMDDFGKKKDSSLPFACDKQDA